MNGQLSLSERLIERRLLSSDELERVRKLQQEQQTPLTRLVVELVFLSEEDLLPVLRDHFDIPLISLKDVSNTPLAIELPPGIGDFFKLARIVPVKIDGRELLVATTDPFDLSRLHALELAVGLTVRPVLAREKEIAARIDALYSSAYSADGNESAAQPIDGIGDRKSVV